MALTRVLGRDTLQAASMRISSSLELEDLYEIGSHYFYVEMR